MSAINEAELYELIDKSIDLAMTEQKYLFKLYPYLKTNKWTRRQVNEFIESTSAAQLNEVILDLEGYIKGGDKTLREAYGDIPKPKARKIRDYLYSILKEAWEYHAERKPGRKPGTKNRRKVSK